MQVGHGVPEPNAELMSEPFSTFRRASADEPVYDLISVTHHLGSRAGMFGQRDPARQNHRPHLPKLGCGATSIFHDKLRFDRSGGGHYIAYARNESSGRWHCYDDSFVSDAEYQVFLGGHAASISHTKMDEVYASRCTCSR